MKGGDEVGGERETAECSLRKRRRKRERGGVYVCDIERKVWFKEGDIDGERASEGERSVCAVKVK